jgi:hypothetical protein
MEKLAQTEIKPKLLVQFDRFAPTMFLPKVICLDVTICMRRLQVLALQLSQYAIEEYNMMSIIVLIYLMDFGLLRIVHEVMIPHQDSTQSTNVFYKFDFLGQSNAIEQLQLIPTFYGLFCDINVPCELLKLCHVENVRNLQHLLLFARMYIVYNSL